MANNNNRRLVNPKTIAKTKQFKMGVADYHAGRWQEMTGRNRSLSAAHLYEWGRLAAAFTGKREVTPPDLLRAYRAGTWPENHAPRPDIITGRATPARTVKGRSAPTLHRATGGTT